MLLLAAAWRCSSPAPDVDDERPKAFRLTPGILVKDSIGQKKGDKIDWKEFSYFKEVIATVTFLIGDQFKPHNVKGRITMFNLKGEEIDRMEVVPGKIEYAFKFLVKRDDHFFFKFEAWSGYSHYLVDTKVEEVDPCLKCGAEEICCKPGNICCPQGTICKDGACVGALKEGCYPPCKSGEVCVDGLCEEACGGWCPKGQTCNVKLNKCVPKVKKQPLPSVTCRAGEVKRGRKCVPVETSACKEPCPPDSKCNEKTGKCEFLGVISGRIVNIYPVDGGTELIINRGSVDGIKQGAEGKIIGVAGGSFVVKEVFQSRCKAKTSLAPGAIGSKRAVTINK